MFTQEEAQEEEKEEEEEEEKEEENRKEISLGEMEPIGPIGPPIHPL